MTYIVFNIHMVAIDMYLIPRNIFAKLDFPFLRHAVLEKKTRIYV